MKNNKITEYSKQLPKVLLFIEYSVMIPLLKSKLFEVFIG